MKIEKLSKKKQQQIRRLIRKIDHSQERIVARPRGSWQWQDAYGLSTWRLTVSRATGDPVWEFVSTRGKWSLPQMDRFGLLNKARGNGRPCVLDMIDVLMSHGLDVVND